MLRGQRREFSEAATRAKTREVPIDARADQKVWRREKAIRSWKEDEPKQLIVILRKRANSETKATRPKRPSVFLFLQRGCT